MSAPVILADEYLSCTQTPLLLSTAQFNKVKTEGECLEACKVRITSLIGGTGSAQATTTGITFDSPQTSLEFNGIRHTCQSCVITVPAMHQLNLPAETGIRYADVSGAELQVYFRGERAEHIGSRYCLVVPIRVGNQGVGRDFFEKLGFLQRSMPTLGSLLDENTALLHYKGTNLEGRTQASAKMACSNAVPLVNYLIYLRPLTMRRADLTRFKKMLEAHADYGKVGGALKASVPLPDKKVALLSYIPSFKLTKGKEPAPKTGYVETAQVKCRPLDTTRDIKGNTVYVGGPGTYRTLQDELADASDVSKQFQPGVAGSTATANIETTLGTAVGIVVGVFLIGLLVWFVLKKTELRYKILSGLYSGARLKPTAAAAAAIK